MFVEPMVVCQFCATVVSASVSQFEVCSLVEEWVTGVHLYESSLGVLPVECALWTSEHVNTAELVVVQVEGRLAHYGYAVEIDAHGWRVDTASYTPHVYG